MVEKGPDAFRTISEVADELALPQHVLRFWETRFSQIKPLKRGGGRRYYRPDDVELLRGIKLLLYDEGYTIKGVQRILKAQGVSHVVSSGQRDSSPSTKLDVSEFGASDLEHNSGSAVPDFEQAPAALVSKSNEAPNRGVIRPISPAPSPVSTPYPSTQMQSSTAYYGDAVTHDQPSTHQPTERAMEHESRPDPTLDPSPVLPRDIYTNEEEQLSHSNKKGLLSRLIPDSDVHGMANSLSRDDVRRLQSTLYELLECKRLLDKVRG